MKCLFACSLALDKIIEIGLEKNEVTDIPLNSKAGPCKLFHYKDNLITVNYYDGSISIVSLRDKKEEYIIYTGKAPKDVKILNDEAYVPCSESNSLSIIDLLEKKMIMSIPLGINPCSIEICNDSAYICNLEEGSITVIDCSKKILRENIKNIEYPIKIIKSKNNTFIYVCESNLGCDKNGNINIYSLNSYERQAKIAVGKTPIDMCITNDFLYVSNFGESSISIIDLKLGMEVSKIYLDYSPRLIAQDSGCIYCGDFIGGGIYEINLNNREIKKIAQSKEPSAIIII